MQIRKRFKNVKIDENFLTHAASRDRFYVCFNFSHPSIRRHWRNTVFQLMYRRKSVENRQHYYFKNKSRDSEAILRSEPFFHDTDRLQRIQKKVSDYLNLVIFGHFQNNFLPKIVIFQTSTSLNHSLRFYKFPIIRKHIVQFRRILKLSQSL